LILCIVKLRRRIHAALAFFSSGSFTPAITPGKPLVQEETTLLTAKDEVPIDDRHESLVQFPEILLGSRSSLPDLEPDRVLPGKMTEERFEVPGSGGDRVLSGS
jgi:hypothetical protein